MAAPAELLELVNRYEQNREAYKASEYKEAQLRREFIDPLLELLGWDVSNKQGYAEAYKEVINEDAIKIGGTTKAPDYGFRIGGTRKFFLETKKPAVNLKDDAEPALQLRRYAWNQKLPLSILTNFEEFAVYDTRIRPNPKDTPATARIRYFTWKEFAQLWDTIYGSFSKDAVLKGSFDKYAETEKDKRGTSEVDDAFLRDIESWREDLAKNIALRNPALSPDELNFAVQATIDRLVFLRICEDRGIETYGRLRTLLVGNAAYSRLQEYFRLADERYNSGLFHFNVEKGRTGSHDTLTPTLAVDDKAIKPIIKSLYYPESPYEFSVMPAEILGQVYEQFLGKVIRLTAGHRAIVEENPEVKKTGGVYYTPAFVVEYIVKRTIGELLSKKTPADTASLKVLDPACGSGSFLIRAYQFLLDWHRDWYVANGPKKHRKELYQGPGGQWLLSVEERKRILLNSIHGVDIDPQAVEVTKLSLLLKVLEQTSGDAIDKNQRIHHERALPDLESNICCGNALIASDFYRGRQEKIISEENKRVNAFDWKTGFPQVIKEGGFDAIIGNPPYIRIQRIPHDEADYLYRTYTSPTSKTDLSLVFIERGISLLRPEGRLSFISTSQWLTTDYGHKLRGMLADGRLREIVDFGSLPVFKKASTYPAIFTISPNAGKVVSLRRITEERMLTLDGIERTVPTEIPIDDLSDEPWGLDQANVGDMLTQRGVPWESLEAFGKSYIGTKSGSAEAFVMTKEEAARLRLEPALLVAYAYQGEEVKRYETVEPDSVIIYPYRVNAQGDQELVPESEMRKTYPQTLAHLAGFKERLRQRLDSRKLYAKGEDWYRHLRAGSFDYIKPPKIAVKGIAKEMRAGLLRENTAFDGANCPSIILKNPRGHHLLYFLAILNSSVATAFMRSVSPPKLSGYLRLSSSYISKIPIRVIDFKDKEDCALHNDIVRLVTSRIAIGERLLRERSPHQTELFKRQAEAVEAQIDSAVLDLYKLKAAEIERPEPSSSA